jgi:GT2 family glycosyltransferase
VSRWLVVIVNYRTPELCVDCLRSLASEVHGRHDVEVVVVDSGSADGSAEAIAAAIGGEGWGAWARVLALAENRGFSAANNAAIRPTLQRVTPPELIWLLNSDTRVRPGAVAELERFLGRRPDVHLVGTRLEEPDGTPQCSAFHFPSVLGELERGLSWGMASRLLARWVMAPPAPTSACPVESAAGASLVLRRVVLEQCGLLDEGFYLYFEDADLCRRARAAGFACWYLPSSRVVHLVGRSSGVVFGQPRRLPAYWFQARRRYFVKHHGRVYATAADIAWTLGFLLWRIRRPLQRKPDGDPPHVLGDRWRHSALWHNTPA